MTDVNTATANNNRQICILIDLVEGGDSKDPKDYTFTDTSGDAANTVDISGDINLVAAHSTQPTGIIFTLSDTVYEDAAWDTSNPLNNIAVVEGENCPPERKGKPQPLPQGWSAMVSSDGKSLLLQDPNPAPSGPPRQPQPVPFDYRLNLKGRHGHSSHNVTIDPRIQNQPV